MCDLEHKLHRLNINKLNDELYREHQKLIEKVDSLNGESSNWKYFKYYNGTPMFYTEEYLNGMSFEYLLIKDRLNRKHFNPSIVQKAMNKLEDTVFRLSIKIDKLRRR